MINKELLKTEIDQVQDKELKEFYKMINAVLEAPHTHITTAVPQQAKDLNWHDFIEATYGSLTNNPIERGAQDTYERREALT